MGPFSHYHYHISDHTHVGNIKGVCHIWYDVDRHMDPSTKLHSDLKVQQDEVTALQIGETEVAAVPYFQSLAHARLFFYICYQSLLMKLDCKGKGSQ